LTFLKDIFLSEINRIFNSLCINVAVLNRLVPLKQRLQLHNHGLHHLHPILNGGPKLANQPRQLLLQHLHLRLICLLQKLRLNLLPFLFELVNLLVFLLNLS